MIAAMTRGTLIALVACALAGCGGTKQDGNDTAIARMKGFADRMCACPDIGCMATVNEEVAKAAAADQRPPSERHLGPEQQKQLDEAARRLAECAARPREMGTPRP